MRWKRDLFLLLGLVAGIFFGIWHWKIPVLAAEPVDSGKKTGQRMWVTFRDMMDWMRDCDLVIVLIYGRDRIISALFS